MKKIQNSLLSPLIVVGFILILLPIFVVTVLQNINRQENFGTLLLLEKGAALIRSFEAGARVGMMGEGWNNRRLQDLLVQTAQQPDIAYLLLIDDKGKILAHSDASRIGDIHRPPLDQKEILASKEPRWRFVTTEAGEKVFEVYKSYRPSGRSGELHEERKLPEHEKLHLHLDGTPGNEQFLQRRMKMHREMQGRMRMFYRQFGFTPPGWEDREPFVPTIVLGFDTTSLEAARKNDRNQAIMTGIILFLASAFGIILLFLFFNYQTTRSSLSRIKAFSDSLLNQMPIGLLAFNGLLEITSVNAFAETLLELSPAERSEASAAAILPEIIQERVNSFVAGDETASGEITCKLASGKVLPLEIDLSRISGDDAGDAGIILLLKDLSQVKALEREIMRSQRLASVGRLAAGVAHEIRNPLSSIKGFATYFKERYPEAEQDQKIARIMIEEVERLNRVVGQLLELARPVEIHPAPAELKQLLADSVRLIERAALEKQVEIVLPDIVPGVFCLDADKIRQVLLNLYLNALDAMPDGGRLSIEAEIDSVKKMLRLSVTDTGVGIDPDDLGKIYDPYYTTKQSGTGLGLAVVHNIIEAHNGSLHVESTPGKGSQFTILVPDSNGGKT